MTATSPSLHHVPEFGNLRRDVAEAALAVFRERGYERATVRLIAQRAGLGTSTLYFHIGSKEELFLALVHPVLDQGIEWLEEIEQEDLPPVEKLRSALVRSAELYDRYPQTFLYLSEFFPTVQSKLPDLARQSKEHWFRLVAAVLELEGRDPSPDDVRLTTYGIMGMFSWMHRWYRQGGSRTSTEIGELLADIVMRGLEPRGPVSLSGCEPRREGPSTPTG